MKTTFGRTFSTAATIASIRHTVDTRDEFYEAENDFFDENGQRVLDKIVSFVGIAPMDDPEYIVLVALDTPSRKTGLYISGGVMAAPTVGAVMADILPYLGVEAVYTDEVAYNYFCEEMENILYHRFGLKDQWRQTEQAAQH